MFLQRVLVGGDMMQVQALLHIPLDTNLIVMVALIVFRRFFIGCTELESSSANLSFTMYLAPFVMDSIMRSRYTCQGYGTQFWQWELYLAMILMW